jgi:hypothetical protein
MSEPQIDADITDGTDKTFLSAPSFLSAIISGSDN